MKSTHILVQNFKPFTEPELPGRWVRVKLVEVKT